MMSQTPVEQPLRPPAPPAPPPSSQTPGGDDPLASLHKMSTTAGVGSADYAAVNPRAIFALLLGLASALALLDEPVLLIFPAAGIIAAVTALWQIARSNGTQTGRGLAAAALVLSLVFGGFVAASFATEGLRTRSDRAALADLIARLAEKVKSGDFNEAYALFSPRFAERINPATFADRMAALRENPAWGKLQSARWNGLAEFRTDETTGLRTGAAPMLLQCEKASEVRMDALFRKVGDRWLFDDLPMLFPAQKSPPS
jgi:hypothetical protein